MEIISDNIDSKNLSFISDGSIGEDNNDKPRIIGNKNENVIYALNPLLSESLNNLVKRFERTKIPKPPPTKGHSIRKKSRVHSSLPNIFLPSIFDDNNKYSEKKVQWTNKLNLDLEKMKILFRDNYNNWCKQKHRSQSIPNLMRNADEADSLTSSSQNVDFICSRSKDENNMTIKFTKCDLKSSNESEEIEGSSHEKVNLIHPEEKIGTISTQNEHTARDLEADTTDVDDQLAYSTHIYLDGAIIEPISPASPVQLSELPKLVTTVTSSSDKPSTADAARETEPIISSQPHETSTTQYNGPAKNKRGRKPGKKKSKSLPSKKVKSDLQIIDLNSSKELESLVESMEEAPRLEQETELDTEPTSVVELPDNIELINLGDDLQDLHPAEIGCSPDQTNDLEILSKSITNSVDTSMLPPRKRYKRLMYLETNKTTTMTTTPSTNTITTSSSPKDVINIESSTHDLETKGESEESKISIDTASTLPPPQTQTQLELKSQGKPAASRSRSKRKKKTSTSSTKALTPVKMISQPVGKVEEQPLTESAPPESMDCDLPPAEILEPSGKALADAPELGPPVMGHVQLVNTGPVHSSEKPSDIQLEIDPATMNTLEIKSSTANIKSTKTLDKEIFDSVTESLEPSKEIRDRIPKKSSEIIAEPVLKESISKKQLIKKSPDKAIVEPSRKPATVIVRPESLKRSKREAAARGFANMVAMSLNSSNSSQVQSVSDSTPVSKQQTTDSSINAAPVSVSAAGKMFKRPRKTKATEPAGHTKSKQKRASSPMTAVPVTDVVNSGDKTVLVDEAPPSPNGTISSSIESISAGSGPVGTDTFIKFRKIRTNTYIDPKPLYWFEEVERCGCKPGRLRSATDKITCDTIVKEPTDSAGVIVSPPVTKSRHGKKRHSGTTWDCGDNCLNRLTYTECPARRCQCGDACQNQKIRKGEWAPGLQVREFSGKGKGVVSTRPIREGAFVIEYVGEVINERTFQERMTTVYRDDPHHYCLHLDGDMLIDAYRAGSLARFVNHSCQPNCEMQKWLVNGAYRMCLFATMPIEPDVELCYDYNFCSFNTENTQVCLCAAPACRGFIGSKPRAERTASQRDRRKLLYIFGRPLSGRERLFIARSTVFLLRNRELGRCQRLGIRRPRISHGNRLPSTISEIKRRKAKKNQFLTQMSALNSIRSIKTRQLRNAEENEALTRAAQLGQVLKDLYNTLLEQKDPVRPGQQLVAPFISPLNRRRYPEFYRTMGASDAVASLGQVYGRLLDGEYGTMLAFDQDVLQMLHHVESYAGKQSTVGQAAERIKPIYRELKANSIALLEALTDEPLDERDKQRLLSNNLQLVTQALRTHSSHQAAAADVTELPDSGGVLSTGTTVSGGQQQRAKRRKQTPASHQSASGGMGARGRLERGAEVIKCVCGFLVEAGHVMVQCERCFVWQHAYCMNVARSAELADVTRSDPYFCHVCSGIATESLVREIPRHFVISDETIGSDNTLFWTLVTSSIGNGTANRDELLKIDDFVYIRGGGIGVTGGSGLPGEQLGGNNAAPVRKTIMRIYSLWKDGQGQRWMEGGLFLRPYDCRLRALIDRPGSVATPATSGPNSSGTSTKRKSSSPLPVLDLETHKWHMHEVVYTDLTTILPLDAYLGRCFVLNSYTFRHGRPLLQNATSTHIDVFVCDWMVNQHGDWSELDPAYLKINTKPYCFERFQDNDGAANERFSRQYLEQDLRKIDEGLLPSSEAAQMTGSPKSTTVVTRRLSKEQRASMKMVALTKLLNKLVDFAQQRNQNLPLSSTPSTASGSNPSSRGASPLSDSSGSKSPIRLAPDMMTHRPRKSLMPRKLIKKSNENIVIRSDDSDTKPLEKESLETIVKESVTIASDTSDSSPQLVIVVDEFQQTPKPEELQLPRATVTTEKAPSIDDKDDLETKTVSSVKENIDEQSNLGSEINFGDFVNLLKSSAVEPAILSGTVAKSSTKQQSPQQQHKAGPVGAGRVQRKSSKRAGATAASRKKGGGSKKNEIKPVSEIRPAEDEWVPMNGATVQVSPEDRPRTRSRRNLTDSIPTNPVLTSTRPPPTAVPQNGMPISDEIDARPESCSSSNNNTNTDVELILTGPNIKGIFTSNDNHPISMTTTMTTLPPSGPITTSVTASTCGGLSVGSVAPGQGPVGGAQSGRLDDDEDDSTKCCFVKLERMKVRQKQDCDTRQYSSMELTERGVERSELRFQHDSGGTVTDVCGPYPVTSHTLSTHLDITGAVTLVNRVSTCNETGSSLGSIGALLSQSDIRLDPSTITAVASSSSSTSPSTLSLPSSSSTALSRSKRKKGVPKRIPFDFPYPQTPVQTTASSLATVAPPLLGTSLLTLTPPATSTGFDDEIVDLSACRPVGSGSSGPLHPDTQQGSSSAISPPVVVATSEISTQSPSTDDIILVVPDASSSSGLLVADPASVVPVPVPVSVPETRHITAANDFSSIENISSN